MIESKRMYPNKYKQLTIYKISVVILFLTSLNPWFFWGIKPIILMALCAIPSASFLIVNEGQGKFITKRHILTIAMLLITMLYLNRRLNVFGFIHTLLTFFNFYTILSLRRELKIDILKFVGKCYAFIILVSLCFYMFKYVGGISLPSSMVMHNDIEQYTYNNYRFFLTLAGLEFMLLPRFQSVFVEPGHLGMIASFLLYVFSFDMRKWYNVALLIGSLLSFSLAAYVLIAIGIILKTVTKVKTAIIGLTLFIASALTIYQVTVTYNGGDNLLNNMIVLRLAIEDGELVGNNRTQEEFDRKFKFAMKDPVKVAFGQELDDEFAWGNSSYSVFIYVHGLFGLFLVIMLYLCFMQGYSSSNSLRLLLLFSASFLQRPYAMWTSQLIIFICGLALLEANKNKINKPKNIQI